MTKVNFHIYYEIDEDEVKTVLRADESMMATVMARGCCWRPRGLRTGKLARLRCEGPMAFDLLCGSEGLRKTL